MPFLATSLDGMIQSVVVGFRVSNELPGRLSVYIKFMGQHSLLNCLGLLYSLSDIQGI